MDQPVELQEYLDVLPFPAFVLDCNNFSADYDSIKPIAVNKACRDGKMGDLVRREIKDNSEFQKWLCKPYDVESLSSTRGQDFFESPELEFSFNFLRGT